jgi:diguanylate cyclase (GGDEF)-like protein
MDRVLLQIKEKRDRRRLEDWLSSSYTIVLPDQEHPLDQEYDLAILDGSSLRELGQKVRAKRKAAQPVVLPFLLLTMRRIGRGPSRHLGRLVDDVVVRPLHEKEVCARVANLLRMRRWSLALKKEHDRAMKLAVTDDVSGFNNTRYLHRYLDRFIESEGARRMGVCLVFFDLDNFKSLVDTHGHLLGSKALKEVAQAVHKVLDAEDRIVRYGGDEFIVILPRQNKQEALAKVGRMQGAIASTRFLQKEGIGAHLTASFGFASYPDDAADKHVLLAVADRCLFESKTGGKSRITTPEENGDSTPRAAPEPALTDT